MCYNGQVGYLQPKGTPVQKAMRPVSNVPSLGVLERMMLRETPAPDQVFVFYTQAPCGRDESYLAYLEGLSSCDEQHTLVCSTQYMDPNLDRSNAPSHRTKTTILAEFDKSGDMIVAHIVDEGTVVEGTHPLFLEDMANIGA